MLTGWPLLLWLLRRLWRKPIDLFHALIRNLGRVLAVFLSLEETHRCCPQAEVGSVKGRWRSEERKWSAGLFESADVVFQHQ